jgi:hypothetical protein
MFMHDSGMSSHPLWGVAQQADRGEEVQVHLPRMPTIPRMALLWLIALHTALAGAAVP